MVMGVVNDRDMNLVDSWIGFHFHFWSNFCQKLNFLVITVKIRHLLHYACCCQDQLKCIDFVFLVFEELPVQAALAVQLKRNVLTL